MDVYGRKRPGSAGNPSSDHHPGRKGPSPSPIGPADPVGAIVHAIDFDYGLTPLRIVHNGHTLQLDHAPGNGVEIDGKRFELVQLRFHTPSEPSIEGRRMAMEGHLMHRSESGRPAVVGIMIEAGMETLATDEDLERDAKRGRGSTGPARILLNARDLLPRDRGQYRYMGSLTTPPCGEGVNRYVPATPIEASPAQIAAFTQAMGENARPIQPINDRVTLGPRL